MIETITINGRDYTNFDELYEAGLCGTQINISKFHYSDKRMICTGSDKTESQQQIEKFMKKAGQTLPSKPTVPSDKVRLLRMNLIFEEVCELIQALGGELNIGGKVSIKLNQANCEVDLEHVAKEASDCEVVIKGTLSTCGIKDKASQEAVNKNNLEKFGKGHKYREDGKLIKPPGFKPPNLHGLL